MPGRQQKFDVQAAWHCKYHVVLIPKCKPSHRTAMGCVMCHVRCRGRVFYVGERRTRSFERSAGLFKREDQRAV